MFVEEFLGKKWVGVLFAVGSGAMFSLSFPPEALSILGWIALVPFYVVVVRVSPLQAFTLGMAWCGAAGFGVAHFFAGTVSEYFSASTAVGWARIVGIENLFLHCPQCGPVGIDVMDSAKSVEEWILLGDQGRFDVSPISITGGITHSRRIA
jgi:hypothetical protein